MNNVFIDTAQNVSIQYNIASLGDRIWAHLIDLLLMGVYAIGTGIIISLTFRGSHDLSVLFLFLLVLLPIVFYHLLFELFNNGQSPGKRALNIKVVKLDGTQLTLGALLVRWAFRLIDFDIFWGAIALVVVAINGRGQRLGDIVAGTTVVRTRTTFKDNVFRFTTDETENYVPTFPQVTTMTEKQMLMIRQTFAQARSSANGNLLEKTANAVTDITQIQRPAELSAKQFLEIVIKDYYYYQNKV